MKLDSSSKAKSNAFCASHAACPVTFKKNYIYIYIYSSEIIQYTIVHWKSTSVRWMLGVKYQWVRLSLLCCAVHVFALLDFCQVGDGTTSVVLLAGEILKHVKSFVEDGLHPQASDIVTFELLGLCIGNIRSCYRSSGHWQCLNVVKTSKPCYQRFPQLG